MVIIPDLGVRGRCSVIEAVNSTIAAAPLLRGLPGMAGESPQAAASAQPAQVSGVLPTAKAPFVSPVVYVNLNYNRAVWQIRDGETGDVLGQIPSDARLAAQQRTARHLAEESVVVEASPATYALPGERAPAPDATTSAEPVQTSTGDAPASGAEAQTNAAESVVDVLA
ncbi:MAG: hypothetical protein JKP92_04525 [Alphaproteobacteria bacterium]|nr:hypothetical protein [Alphaproteobacteria bacterium]